jgi:hypothetical protein
VFQNSKATQIIAIAKSYTIALTDGETVNRNCKPYKQQGCMLASGKRSIAKGFS